MTQKPKVSIIIVNWNGLSDTSECLESLMKVTYPNYEIVVVDNGSNGGDARVLKERYGKGIRLIENDRNYGFVKAALMGMRDALERGADYVLLLGNDTVVAPDFLEELVRAAEDNPNFAILAPTLYQYGQGNEVQSGGEQAVWFGLKTVRLTETEGVESVLNSTWVSGTCMLLERDKLERMGVIPAMEPYFLYGDATWCLSALRAGFGIGYVPRARVWHKGSRSLGRMGPSRMRWAMRDYVILGYHFWRSGYFRSIPPSEFMTYASWIYLRRPLDLAKLLLRNPRWGNIAGLFKGLAEGVASLMR